METCSWSGRSGDGAFPIPRWHVTGATSPKIYWHTILSAVIKALGSRKAKGTGEHGEGEISQALSFSTQKKKRWEEEEHAYSTFPTPGACKAPVYRRIGNRTHKQQKIHPDLMKSSDTGHVTPVPFHTPALLLLEAALCGR